jgi:hypothetical protein
VRPLASDVPAAIGRLPRRGPRRRGRPRSRGDVASTGNSPPTVSRTRTGREAHRVRRQPIRGDHEGSARVGVSRALSRTRPRDPDGRRARTIRARALPRSETAPERQRAAPRAARSTEVNRRRPTLPGPFGPSTIGAERLNCSVRNGKRCFPLAIATGNSRELPGGPSELHSNHIRMIITK